MELNFNGIMARIPDLGVVDYGLELQVLKRLVMFLCIFSVLKMNHEFSRPHFLIGLSLGGI